MSNTVPRPEYPRPQFVRKEWINLNGTWEFEIDHGNSGVERKFYHRESLADKITVPFCPESSLSGVENKDFMSAVWYKRAFEIPAGWSGKKVLLHFGAVDYDARVWINGELAGKHCGGYTPFALDITAFLQNEKNVIMIKAEDDTRSGKQPRGKQSGRYFSQGCDYTRTTGIWQTVWLECVPMNYVENIKFTPDPENKCVHLEGKVVGDTTGSELCVTVNFENKISGETTLKVVGNRVRGTVALSEIHLWGPGEPNLYTVMIQLLNSETAVDKVESYFGLRSVSIKDKAILINGKPVFQRLVLDQGFYPDGIYTAPSDEALKKDIEISLDLGFNGARMHEKVFEPRFIYWADKMGYLIWGEHANWGLDITTPLGLERFLPEWMEILERDYSSPAIIGWCPFNETWDQDGTRQDDEVLRNIYEVTKAIDQTRPVIDTSGNFHVITDIYDVHDYEQDVEKFAAKFEPMKEGGEVYNTFSDRQSYGGQPYFVSEYGGIWWKPGDNEGWGYGERPKTEEEFMKRYQGLTEALLLNKNICAFCYTQLYDVEQEVNGLYTYQREAKFNTKRIKKINSQKAAIE